VLPPYTATTSHRPMAGHTNARSSNRLPERRRRGTRQRRNILWEMRNGYALCTTDGLAAITQKLDSMDANALNALRDLLRVGIHGGVHVVLTIQ
jgi:hypothetical protein